MSSLSPMFYTRDDLKGLKAERDREIAERNRLIHEQNVNLTVQEISQYIIKTAQTTDKTSTIYPAKLPNDENSSTYRIMIDAIEKLKERFVDVSIEYKFQTDIRTGREFNHGVYIDWS